MRDNQDTIIEGEDTLDIQKISEIYPATVKIAQKQYSIFELKRKYENNNRQKAKEHLKALLKNANNIFMYDKHFTKQWSTTKQFFEELIPKKSLTIFYRDNHFTQEYIRRIKQIYN